MKKLSKLEVERKSSETLSPFHRIGNHKLHILYQYELQMENARSLSTPWHVRVSLSTIVREVSVTRDSCRLVALASEVVNRYVKRSNIYLI